MKVILTILILCTLIYTGFAITLEECLAGAENNFAETTNIERNSLIEKLGEKSLNSNYLPQISMMGTYRQNSESTEISLSGLPFQVEFPEQSKESYFVGLQLEQMIYDGGITGRQLKLSKLQNRYKQNGIKGKLLQRKLEVSGLYYGILISREQERILKLHKESLASELHKVTNGVEAGILDISSEYMIEEQLWQLAEELFEVKNLTLEYMDKLNLLTGLDISDDDMLESGIDVSDFPPDYNRADLQNHLLQIEMEKEQSKVMGSGLLPILQFSASASLGNPGYNLFEDEMHDYYSASVNLSWKLWDWNKRKNTIKEHELGAKKKEKEYDVSVETINLQVIECDSEIAKLSEELRILDERQALLSLITANYGSKLSEGMISSSEYLHQFNKQKSCELEQAAREIQKEFILIKKLLIMGGEI